jgi:hypothetical protein
MSDDPKTTESGSEPAIEELPIPKIESASTDSPPSSLDIDSLAETILKKLSPELDKKLQSTKDKRISEIEKRLNLGQFAELEELGAQIPENVKLEYRLRELEGRNAKAESPAQRPSQGSGAQLSAQDVSQVITDLQLDANDPQVIEALRGSYRSRDHFDAAMTKLAYARVTKPNPSPSAAPAVQGKPAPAHDLQSEYEKRRNEIASTMRGDQKTRALAELRVQMRGKGLNNI